MKYIYLLILLSFNLILIGCNKADKRNLNNENVELLSDARILNLNENVLTIIEKKHPLFEENGELFFGDLLQTDSFKFDQGGNLIESSLEYSSGSRLD